MMERLFIAAQFMLPQHLLSRLTGVLAASRITWLKNLLIKGFIRQFDVDMSEAANPDPASYQSFNDFFTRELRADARSIASEAGVIACPADGAISQIGELSKNRILQAKGHDYHVSELLAGQHAGEFTGGSFATVYLSPRDYHRLHMPLDGELISTTYVPGDLFSVNTATANNVSNLFARNERLICRFETEAGPMAMILVGAMIVAGIETVWSGRIAPPPRTPSTVSYKDLPAPVTLTKGDEMGRFFLGSTVILLFAENAVQWDSGLTAGSETRMGMHMGQVRKTD